MEWLLALVAAFLAFAIALAVPLFVQRWSRLALVVLVGAAFFAWLTWDLGQAAAGEIKLIGPLLGGLMLFGFAGGVIAKFVMLVARKPADEP